MKYLVITGINPEPWTAPDVTIGYGRGRKPYLVVSTGARQRAYQNAIKESVTDAYGDSIVKPPTGTKLRVTFLFWRQIDSYTNEKGRSASRNTADTTNMIKSTEDALQGILYDNDRHNRWVTGIVIEEGHDIEPKIIVIIEPISAAMLANYRAIAETLDAIERPAIPGNVGYLDDQIGGDL